jgi:hypothetical protein
LGAHHLADSAHSEGQFRLPAGNVKKILFSVDSLKKYEYLSMLNCRLVIKIELGSAQEGGRKSGSFYVAFATPTI